LSNAPSGIALARERGWLLAWDDHHWLYLLDHDGNRQAMAQLQGVIATACCADDGSAYAAVGSKGEVWWLAPDLSFRWERAVPAKAVGAALDSFGQYLAVSDAKSTLYVFDRFGRTVMQTTCPRPLHHLAFVPAGEHLIGSSDFGLVACHDLQGRLIWRDGLVSHVGSMTLRGDGECIVLACFTDGLQRYDLRGCKLDKMSVVWPCRLAVQSFDGSVILVAWLTKQLLLLDADGRNLCTYALDKPIVGLALSALGDQAYAALADGPVVSLAFVNG
jgi:WD40 repeat protein